MVAFLRKRFLRVAASASLVLLCLFSWSFSETLWVQGTVICREQAKAELERPARYIIVMPEEDRWLAVASNENGFYGIAVPYKKAIDRTLTLYYISGSTVVGVKRKCIWEEEVKKSGRRKTFRFPTVLLEQACESVEADYSTVQEDLWYLKSAPPGSLTVEMALASPTPRVLSYLYALAVVPLLAFSRRPASPDESPPLDSIRVDTLNIEGLAPKLLKDDEFQSYISGGMSTNLGFNLAPTRNLREAVFSNPSAIGTSYFSQFSADTDFKSFFRSGLLFRPMDGFGVGLGLVFLDHEEIRSAELESNEKFLGSVKAKNWMAFVSGSLHPRHYLSVGVTCKYLSQSIQNPHKVERVTRYYTDQTVSTDNYFILHESESSLICFDLSAAVRLTSSMKVGLNLANVGVARLGGDDANDRELRSIGIGCSYQKRRLHLGADLRLSEGRESDVAAGFNLMPLDFVTVNLGLGYRFRALASGIKYKIVSFTVNTNDIAGTSYVAGVDLKF